MSHRTHIDNSIKLIGKLLFGIEKSPRVLSNVRSSGVPLVDDWNCLKSMVRVSHTFCSSTIYHELGNDELPTLHRFENLRLTADLYPNTGWNTCDPSPIFVTRAWASSKWRRHPLKPAPSSLLIHGVLSIRASVLDNVVNYAVHFGLMLIFCVDFSFKKNYILL